MSGVSQVGASAPVASPQESGAAGADASASLLPAPECGDDPMAALYALFSKDRQAGAKASMADVQSTQAARKKAIARAKNALREAARAKSKGGFWSNLAKKCGRIAKYAAVASSIALAVGTAGAGTPIFVLAVSGATLSSASLACSETRVLQDMGVSEKWAGRISLGMSLGGAACGVGVGAVALSGGAASSGALAEAGQNAGAVASGLQGVSTASAGYASWRAGNANADASQRFADVAKERAAADRLDRMLLQILADLESSEQSDQRTLGHLRGAMEARDNALSLSVMKV